MLHTSVFFIHASIWKVIFSFCQNPSQAVHCKYYLCNCKCLSYIASYHSWVLRFFTKSLALWGSKMNLIYNPPESLYFGKVMNIKKKKHGPEFRKAWTQILALPLDVSFWTKSLNSVRLSFVTFRMMTISLTF